MRSGTGQLRRRAERRILHARVHRERGRALPHGRGDGVLSRTGNLARAFLLSGGTRDFPRDGEGGPREVSADAVPVRVVLAGAGDARLVPRDVHRATHAKFRGERERGTLPEGVRVVVFREHVRLVRPRARTDAAVAGFAAVPEREPGAIALGLRVLLGLRVVRVRIVVAVAVVIAGTGTRRRIVAGSRGGGAEGKRGPATAGTLDAVPDVAAQFVQISEIFSDGGGVATGSRGRPIDTDFTPERESFVSRPADVAVVGRADDVVRAGAGNVLAAARGYFSHVVLPAADGERRPATGDHRVLFRVVILTGTGRVGVRARKRVPHVSTPAPAPTFLRDVVPVAVAKRRGFPGADGRRGDVPSDSVRRCLGVRIVIRRGTGAVLPVRAPQRARP